MSLKLGMSTECLFLVMLGLIHMFKGFIGKGGETIGTEIKQYLKEYLKNQFSKQYEKSELSLEWYNYSLGKFIVSGQKKNEVLGTDLLKFSNQFAHNVAIDIMVSYC